MITQSIHSYQQEDGVADTRPNSLDESRLLGQQEHGILDVLGTSLERGRSGVAVVVDVVGGRCV